VSASGWLFPLQRHEGVDYELVQGDADVLVEAHRRFMDASREFTANPTVERVEHAVEPLDWALAIYDGMRAEHYVLHRH
jgi:hypothetical protein